MDHDSQLQNKLFRNWVRSSVGLKYLQQGLEPFVDEQAQLQHSSFLTLLPSTALVTHIHCSKCTSCRTEHNCANCNISPVVHAVSGSHILCQTCSIVCCPLCNVKFCNRCNGISAEDVIKCKECNFENCNKCKLSYCKRCSESGEGSATCVNYKYDHCVDIKHVHSGKCDITNCSDCLHEYCKFCMKLANKRCLCSMQSILPAHLSKSCPSAGKCNCQRPRTRLNCLNNVCGMLYDAIVKSHALNDPIWSNTNPVHWTSSYWEVAKCFLGGSGYRDTQTAADTDASGLLSICINSTTIGGKITNIDNFKKARQNRNHILHTGTFEVDGVDLTMYIDQMIAVLTDNTLLNGFAATAIAVDNLKKLKNDEIHITKQSVTEALRTFESVMTDTVKLFHSKLDQTNKDVADFETRSKVDIDAAESRSKKYTDTKISQLEKEVERMKKVVNQLQETSENSRTDKVIANAKVTCLINNVPDELEEKISEDVVSCSNELIKNKGAGPDSPLANVLNNGHRQLQAEKKTVTSANHKCIALNIRCETLAALVSLYRDCFSGRLTTLFKPLEDVLRKTYDRENLTLEIMIHKDDFWASVEAVLFQLDELFDVVVCGTTAHESANITETDDGWNYLGNTVEDMREPETHTSNSSCYNEDIAMETTDENIQSGNTIEDMREPETYTSNSSCYNEEIAMETTDENIQSASSIHADPSTYLPNTVFLTKCQSTSDSEGISSGSQTPLAIPGSAFRKRKWWIAENKATFITNMTLSQIKEENLRLNQIDHCISTSSSSSEGSSVVPRDLTLTDRCYTHTEITQRMYEAEEELTIHSILCTPDSECGCQMSSSEDNANAFGKVDSYEKQSKKLFKKGPSMTTLNVSKLRLHCEGETLRHIRTVPNLVVLNITSTDYTKSSTGMSDIMRILPYWPVLNLTLAYITCTHSDITRLLYVPVYRSICINHVKCVADADCGCQLLTDISKQDRYKTDAAFVNNVQGLILSTDSLTFIGKSDVLQHVQTGYIHQMVISSTTYASQEDITDIIHLLSSVSLNRFDLKDVHITEKTLQNILMAFKGRVHASLENVTMIDTDDVERFIDWIRASPNTEIMYGLDVDGTVIRHMKLLCDRLLDDEMEKRLRLLEKNREDRKYIMYYLVNKSTLLTGKGKRADTNLRDDMSKKIDDTSVETYERVKAVGDQQLDTMQN